MKLDTTERTLLNEGLKMDSTITELNLYCETKSDV